jgi:hypothetical protein
MDTILIWLVMAFAQFVAFAILRPSFTKKWWEGFVQGALVFCITMLIGYGYCHYHESHRQEEMFNQIIQNKQHGQSQQLHEVLPAKNEEK